MLAVRDDRDSDAFALLFDFYAPRLKAMALRTGSTSSNAEELVQDVMLRLWRSAHSFDPGQGQVSSWIYRIARNRGIDIAQTSARMRPTLDPVSETVTPGVDTALDLEADVARLRDAMRRLPLQQREMVTKAYMGELTHSEISRQSGLPLGTVKSRLKRGLERLRHELRDLRE